ncbi:DUF4911 domain-containing protein [Syntrophus gentianae]|uniref:DUF4911 domain-containing protein n=1 Tax=Syntrophus gentianae TaxID=43775 RepID=UPI0015871B07|nr:DUF4911 domain-containing protein [Syntrophus gentianae]
MKKQDIAYLQFILEGYEGVCSVSTIDSRVALIGVTSMPGFEAAVTKILAQLKSEVEFHES